MCASSSRQNTIFPLIIITTISTHTTNTQTQTKDFPKPPTPTFNMQFSFTATALFLSLAAASPFTRQVYTPCSGLYSTPECCATDVLGVADLDCADPPTVPSNATEFQSICSAVGQRARCCVLPIVRLHSLVLPSAVGNSC